jgi:hypothetical protein
VHLREVDVTGIDNHELNSLKLVDGCKDHDQQRPRYWDLPTVRLSRR